MLYLQIVGATVLVSLISLVGVFFSSTKLNFKKWTFYFLSLASGTMLGTTFLHLLPESLATNPTRALPLTCVGVLIFFTFEKFLIWRHCHLHPHPDEFARPTAAKMVLVGDSVHNFIDGIIIASSFLASPQVGLTVTFAIMLHEIPQEVGDFAILLHGGYSVRKALILNVLSGLAAFLGATLAYLFLSAVPVLQSILLPMAAGGFLYIALADLIPQLHGNITLRQTFEQILLLCFGILILVLVKHQ
jgi:zinc and cadmium transporter